LLVGFAVIGMHLLKKGIKVEAMVVTQAHAPANVIVYPDFFAFDIPIPNADISTTRGKTQARLAFQELAREPVGAHQFQTESISNPDQYNEK
jgi:hypothetical protein